MSDLSAFDRVLYRERPTDVVAMPLALKNADDLLRTFLRDVDINRDGQIDYNGKCSKQALFSGSVGLLPPPSPCAVT